MKMLIKFLAISIASIMCASAINIKAAEPEEGWEQLSSAGVTDALFIQNDSCFPLIIIYRPVGSDREVTKFLPGGWGTSKNVSYLIAQPQTVTGNVLIRIGQRQHETVSQLLQAIPGLTTVAAVGKQFAKTVMPYYTTLEALTGYATKIAAQTLTIDPRKYTPGTILVYYWPLGFAALNYPPTIVPLKDANAAMAWINVQDTLDKAIIAGKEGATTAYHVIQDFIKGQKALNSEQIGKIEIKVKENLPAIKPQPRPGLIEEYEQPQ